MLLLFLIVTVLAGIVLARLGWLKQLHVHYLNKWIINIALPAVALYSIPKMMIDETLMALILTPISLFALAYVIFFYLVPNLSLQQRIALTILTGLGNTSFLGFPFIDFYYGANHMHYAVIYDQIGFLLLTTIAQLIINKDSPSDKQTQSWKRILLFPPFLALLIALILPTDWSTDIVDQALELIGKSISPVAMLVVGFHLSSRMKLRLQKTTWIGLVFKLLLFPLLVFILLPVFNLSEGIYKIAVIESGMSPMISASILLIDRNIAKTLTGELLCWGIIASFITSPIWYFLLELDFDLF